MFLATAATAALAVAVSLQLGSFLAPAMAIRALGPAVVSNVRNLAGRFLYLTIATVAVLNLAAVLVEVPWLMLPVFVLILGAINYLVPILRYPVRGYMIGLIVIVLFYDVVFDAEKLGYSALNLSCSSATGLAVATAMAAFRRKGRPRDRLSAAIASSFAAARELLHAAGERFRAASPPQESESHVIGALAQHLQLLDLVRHEGVSLELERGFLALITACDRAACFAGMADHSSRQNTGRTYRRLVDSELAALLEAMDLGLAGFERAAHDPASVFQGGRNAPAPPNEPWPDFDALVVALRARQDAVRANGQPPEIGFEESANLNGFAQALAGLADVLHSAPGEMERAALAPRRRGGILPIDPYAAAYGLKVGVASCLGVIIAAASHEPKMETIAINPLLLAQASYGATIRNAGLRLAGIVAGGLLAVLTVNAVMPNTTELAAWLVVFFAVCLAANYIAQGTPRTAYFGTQMGITYMIVLVADHPSVDVNAVLWRFLGAVLGIAVTIFVFEVLVPDYAGRQLVSRFGDIVKNLLPMLPTLDRPVVSADEGQRRGEQVVTAIADVLRLSEEVRYEHDSGGVDPEAAVNAAGTIRRAANRWALVRRLRRETRPPLTPALHGAIARVEDALLRRMRNLDAFLDARHHRDRLRSRQHQDACAAALAIAERPMPPLDGPLADLAEAAATWRREESLNWPLAAASNLLAEIEHWRRLAVLVPALTQQLHRMCLPAEAAASFRPAAGRATASRSAP